MRETIHIRNSITRVSEANQEVAVSLMNILASQAAAMNAAPFAHTETTGTNPHC
jgi:hypothetical protein